MEEAQSSDREAGLYHLDRGIRQVDELGQDLAIFARSIQFGGIP